MKRILLNLLLLSSINYASDIVYNRSYNKLDTKFDVYNIIGGSEVCEVTVSNKEKIYSTTCVSVTNSKNKRILCTKKKNICKTEAEIIDFVKPSEVQKELINIDTPIQHTSDRVEEVSIPWHNAEAPLYDVYIDLLEAFPRDYIEKNSRILCTKLSIREDSRHENIYNISGMCQLSKTKSSARLLNPFSIQFLSVKRIAELIMDKKYNGETYLDGILIKDDEDISLAKYIFVVNRVTDKK